MVFDIVSLDYHIGSPGGPPETADAWSPMTSFDFNDLTGSHDIWLRLPMPDGNRAEPMLLVSAFLNDLDVYQGDTLIYTHGRPSDGEHRNHMSHLVPIGSANAGESLFLHSTYPDRTGLGDIFLIALGEADDILDIMIAQKEDLYRSSLVDLCLGFLLLVIGAGSFFIFLIRWKERSYPFFSFGMFALFVALTYLADAHALFFPNLSPKSHYYLKSVSFLLVPAGLFAFFNAVFTLGPRSRMMVRGLWIIHAALAWTTVMPAFSGPDLTVGLLVLMILSCLTCIVIIQRSHPAASADIRRIFTVFFLLFMLLILIHLLERLGLVPITFDVFGWSMVGFVFVLGYVMIRHYTSTFYTMQTVSLELEKKRSEFLELQKENILSQFEALKNQVDPHFLFNSFGTLSSIIEDNPKAAVCFLQELSRVYRYVLQTRSSALVSLKEELDFLESYRFLMSKRFGDNLSIAITVPDACTGNLILPFSLQLLVENAIKHNIVSRKKPLSIRVFVRDQYLIVSNRLQKKTPSMPSTRIGLDNITNRYRLLTDREVRIMETQSDFCVWLPMLENKGQPHERSDH
ncbi:hypothetical protein JCM14469_12240 [Desulfatiferula olefinivorans]